MSTFQNQSYQPMCSSIRIELLTHCYLVCQVLVIRCSHLSQGQKRIRQRISSGSRLQLSTPSLERRTAHAAQEPPQLIFNLPAQQKEANSAQLTVEMCLQQGKQLKVKYRGC
eukprot:1162113-Pelagomonas_calceolata.AAC.12